MIEQTPRVSFGVPVRNGEGCIAMCLESILAQDFGDFEIVVSDNASTDGTPDILREYAAKDDRIRLSLRDENVGIIENFNSLVHLSRGEFFRWVGADDWLEPSYASDCVAAFDAQPDAVAATSYFQLHYEDGGIEHQEYRGEVVDSPLPERRLARMLWFFHAGASVYEPNYSLIRRQVLEDVGVLPIHAGNDWILSTRLCLSGRMIHVPKMLFHRSFPIGANRNDESFRKRLNPEHWRELRPSLWKLSKAFLKAVDDADLDARASLRCRLSILAFNVREAGRRTSTHLRRFRRESLGITRARLGVEPAPKS